MISYSFYLITGFVTPILHSFSCPSVPANKAGLYSDPQDCQYYYQCDGIIATHHKCPGGLYFNAAKLYCDWPNQSGCSK